MLFGIPYHILDNCIEANPLIIAAVVIVVALNVVEQGFPGRIRTGCLTKVLLKRVVGELKRLFGSFRPHMHVHACVNGHALTVDSSSPAVIPVASCKVLQLENDNFRDWVALAFQLLEGRHHGNSGRSTADNGDSLFYLNGGFQLTLVQTG